MAATPGMLAAAPHERNLEVMKMKRDAHSVAIESRKKQKALAHSDVAVEEEENRNFTDTAAPLNSGRFRDDSFYLSHEPAAGGRTAEQFLAVGSGDQFKDAVIDLGGEDMQGEAQRKSASWHWDNKSKRYVKLQKGEIMKAGTRAKSKSQSGPSKASKEKEGSLYKRWTKKTKMSIGKSNADSRIAQAMGGRFKRGGRGWENPLKPVADDPDKHKGSRNEMKNADQVRKQRKEEQKKRERNMPKKARTQASAPGGGRKKNSHKAIPNRGVKGMRVSTKRT